VLGCGVGWFLTEMQRAKIQQDAVAHIRNVRGHATYDYQINRADLWFGAKPLRSLMGNDFLCYVHTVSIHDARDRDLESLPSLSRLNDLRLNSRQVTDEGLPHLRYLSNLKRLDLWCEQVTDQGLQHIGGLKKLESLDLLRTQVTDAGLARLGGLTNLRLLKLRNTKVTSAGLIRLQELLPDCQILGVASDYSSNQLQWDERQSL
jgi:hypothetical protein